MERSNRELIFFKKFITFHKFLQLFYKIEPFS